jgi:PAS domain S-box-containing protein
LNDYGDDRKSKHELLSELASLRAEVARLRERADANAVVVTTGTAPGEPDVGLPSLMSAWADVDRFREQAERLDAALAAGGAGTFRWDIRTNDLTWDVSLDRLFGLEPGRTAQSIDQFVALVHPDDRAAVIDAVKRCRDVAADFEMEFRVVWPGDGSVHWLYDKGQTFLGDDGRPLYMTGACVDVTARHTSDRRLRELRMLVEQSPDFIGIAGPDLHAYYVNPAGRRLVGLSEEDVPRTKVIEYFPPGERERIEREVIPLLHRDGKWDGEVLFQHFRTGELFHMSWNVFLSRDERTGEIVNYCCVSRDITRQKQMEAELRAGEARSRALFEALPNLAWVNRPDGSVEYFNQKWTQYTGLSDHPSGAEWVDAWHPDDRARLLAVRNDAIAAGRPYQVDARLRRVDGVYRWHQCRVEPVHDVAGKRFAWLGTAADIDDLRAKQEQLTFAYEVAAAGAFEWDIVGNVNYWSPELEMLYGLEPGSFGGTYKHWRLLAHADDLPRVEDEARRSLETGSFVTDFRIVRKCDGVVRWVHARARVVRDEQTGQPLRMIGINVDITERKAAEDAVAAAREEAERASRAKDQFLAALSHELRTPLTPILMTAQLLEHDDSLSDSLREDMSMIRRNVELETRLIDDLLDLTRISRGKIELRRQRVDLHAVLREAANLCCGLHELATRRLKLVTDLAAADHVLSAADPTRMSQVFWNLLKNAVKFTPPGGTITVRTRNPQPAGGIEIEVTDTGVGIDPAVLPRIFDAFEQGGDHVTKRFGGLGLGLAICRALIRLHGGDVTATSAGRDRGATFAVRLPL